MPSEFPADPPSLARESGSTTPAGGDMPDELCARCHRPIIHRGNRRGCLRCLADFAMEAEREPGTDVPAAENQSMPMPTRYGHFEIALGRDGLPIELGSGATATTYRAQDTVLNTAVALKVINQTVAGHQSARSRFLREARTAAKLHHPNVASVTYYGEQAGRCYYVMELVEGETLETRVRREGPLAPALAMEVGIQIAHALVATETAGVVHRDLKPSNLMLVARQGKDGSQALAVKVIDWGLAKAVSAEPFLEADYTRGGFVGTPAFASPEQFAHPTDGRIDIRSDIYSLGVTLWYLLCGRAPFVGRSLEEIHNQQTREPLPFEQLNASGVPTPLTALLRTMLAVDPRKRLQSARELLGSLERCRAHLARKRRYRRAAMWTAAGGLCCWLLVASVYRRPAQPPGVRPSAIPKNQTIAILPFKNLSLDGSGSFFIRGMGEKVAGKLSHVAALTVIRAADEPDRRDLAAIGKRLGVDYVLEGEASRDQNRIRCKMSLVNTRQSTAAPLWQKEYQGPLAGVFAMEADIARTLLRCAGVVPSPAEAIYVDTPSTTNVEAYDLYLRAALGSPRSAMGPAGMRQALRQQIGWLERAVTLDPKFVLAYGDLAIAHDRFSLTGPDDSPEGRSVDHRALAEAALQKARQVRPDDGDLHIATAHHFNVVNHDQEQARVEAELAQHTLPNEARIHLLLGTLARLAGRWEEGIREFQKAAVLSPGDPYPFSNLTSIYRSCRRYEEADAACARLLAMSPSGETFTNRVLQATGPLEQRADLGPLRALLFTADEAQHPPGTPAYDEGRLTLALCARDPEGVSRVLAGNPRLQFAVAGFAYPAGWFAALAARMRGDAAGAHAAFASARETAVEAAQTNSGDPQCMSVLAMIDAGLGQREDAVREGRLACEMSPAARSAMLAPAIAANLAVVYAWTDQPDQAFALLDDLAGRNAGENWWYRVTYGDLLLNPVWDPLRGDPRFEALSARLAPSHLP